MLLEFSATNFRSIKDRQTISMRASAQDSFTKKQPENLIFPTVKNHGGPLIRSAMFFGANASGKSNLLKALRGLQFLVTNSDSFKLDKSIPPFEPFMLDKSSREKPTIFEIDFIANNNLRYLYSVSYNEFKILKEELVFYETAKPKPLFSRIESGKIEFGSSYKGRKDFSLLSNQLLLSKAGTDSIPVLTTPYRFFSSDLFYSPAQSFAFEQELLLNATRFFSEKNDLNDPYKKAIISMINAADVSIKNIHVVNLDETQIKFPEYISIESRKEFIEKLKRRIVTTHAVIVRGQPHGAVFEATAGGGLKRGSGQVPGRPRWPLSNQAMSKPSASKIV